MEEQYIDIRNMKQQLEVAIARLKADADISDRNKDLILKFLRDAQIGKTVVGKAKKKIGPSTQSCYIQHLRRLMEFVKHDLDAVTQDDMEQFITALESGEIRSKAPRVRGTELATAGSPLSVRYQVNIKKTIKKFYKWLWGESGRYAEIIEWIDTYCEAKEIPALTEAEVGALLDRAKTPLQRAVIQVLFDGGFRISELLNIRLRHVRLITVDPEHPDGQCFAARVPFSKTTRRTVVLPMQMTSKWLSMWLEEHPARSEIAEDGTITARDVNAQLFPMTDNAVRLLVGRLGRAALGKRVYPHLLRHTSATYWCNRLPYFKFCKRFGWSMTSAMPQRYIDREGIDDLDVARRYMQEMDRRNREQEVRMGGEGLQEVRSRTTNRSAADSSRAAPDPGYWRERLRVRQRL